MGTTKLGVPGGLDYSLHLNGTGPVPGLEERSGDQTRKGGSICIFSADCPKRPVVGGILWTPFPWGWSGTDSNDVDSNTGQHHCILPNIQMGRHTPHTLHNMGDHSQLP